MMNKIVLLVGMFLGATVMASPTQIFDPPVSHWNHVHKLKLSGDLAPSHEFDLTKQGSRMSIRLLRNIVKNQHKHVNGLQWDLREYQLTFGDFTGVHFAMHLDETSTQPNSLALNEYPQSYASLTDSQHHFSLVFYGEAHSQQAISTPMMEFRIKLGPGTKNDFRLTPEKAMGYFQQHWQETYVKHEQLKHLKIAGVLLMAEAANFSTLENLTQQWPLPKSVYIESQIEVSNLTLLVGGHK